jgi:hypothetical protein
VEYPRKKEAGGEGISTFVLAIKPFPPFRLGLDLDNCLVFSEINKFGIAGVRILDDDI